MDENAPHCTAVGLRSAYAEKHENCTDWDNKREEQSNVNGIFVQIVHVLDVYIVVCMLKSTTWWFALLRDGEESD